MKILSLITKRFALGLFVSLLLVAGVGAQVTHAQTTTGPCTITNGDYVPGGDAAGPDVNLNCKNADGSTVTNTAGAGTGNITTTKTDAAGNTVGTPTVSNPVVTGAANAAGDTFSCLAGGAVTCLLSAIAWFVFQLAATVLGFVGLIFNWIVVLSVFQFGTYFGNSAGLLLGWSILRDIGNIMLLFAFIFMGIMTMLDTHSFDTRRAIPRLLIFAVFLNFSLFASEAVIDGANFLSASLYQQAGQSSKQDCSAASNGVTSCTQQQVGISGAIIEASGLTTIWNLDDAGVKKISGNNGTSALVMMLLAVFMLIAAVVLGAGAIMLFIRALTLIFLLVLSPLGFAAMAIPQLEQQGKDWWNKLISQAFFAPVFILLILVSLQIVRSLQSIGMGTGQTFASAIATPGSTTVGIVIIFMIVIGFLVGSLMSASKMGAMGAGFATKTAGNLVGGATFGAAAFIGRRTGGALADKAGTAIRSSTWARNNQGLARIALKATDKVSHASFDARGTKTIGALAKATKIDFGQAGKTAKGGFHAIEEKAVKERLDLVNNLKQTQTEKDLEQRFKDEKKSVEQQKKEAQQQYERERESKEITNTANARTRQAEENRAQEEIAQKEKGIREATQVRKDEFEQQRNASRDSISAMERENRDRENDRRSAEADQRERLVTARQSGDQNEIAAQTATYETLRQTNQAALTADRQAVTTLRQQETDLIAYHDRENKRIATEDREDVEYLNASLENVRRDNKRASEQEEAELENDRRDHTRNIRELSDVSTNLTETQIKSVDRNAPKRQAAEKMEHDAHEKSNPFLRPTLQYTADHHAAEKILGDLNKTDTQRLIDSLAGVQKGLSNAGGGGGHGGGGHAPAAPAAAAHPAPAPAAGGHGGGGGAHH